jgi:hypothetical protein
MKTVITPRLRPISRPLRLFAVGLFLLASLIGFSPKFLKAAAQRDGEKPYALIFGTVWGPDNRPVYGVTVKIRRAADKPKKVRWEVYSDHHGEFAQRVPIGEADYILSANVKGIKGPDGRPLHLVEEVKVHVYNDEREDTGLHLAY